MADPRSNVEVWTRQELAAFLRVAVRTLTMLVAAGKVPAGVKVGNQPRWSAAEMRRWFAAGCPAATEWQRIKHSTPKNPRNR